MTQSQNEPAHGHAGVEKTSPPSAKPSLSPSKQAAPTTTPNQPAPESNPQQTKQNTKPQRSSSNLWLKRWLYTLVFSLVLSLLFIGYFYVQKPSLSSRTLNLAIADTSVILIGLSLALSGLTYFWDFADRYIVYRKNLGVTGFIFALLHTGITFYRMGELDAIIGFASKLSPNFLFGLMSILLLLFLTVISNTTSARIFGNVWWRRLLRLGYLALLFGLIHFGFMRYDNWLEWFQEPAGLPDTSLLLVLFGVLVFVLRLFLEISLRLKSSTNDNHSSSGTN